MSRLDGTFGRRPFGKADDAAHAGGNEDPVPEAIVARTERSPNVVDNVGGMRPDGVQTRDHAGVVLLDQCQQEMSDADVVMVMIATRLLR